MKNLGEKSISALFGMAVVLIVANYALAVWGNPAGSPSTATSRPMVITKLDDQDKVQTKSGLLTLNSGGSDTSWGLNVIAGNVGVGVAAPVNTLRLQVGGRVASAKYCDQLGTSGTCIDQANASAGGVSDASLPKGTIAAFTSSCPTGWTSYADLVNRVPLGTVPGSKEEVSKLINTTYQCPKDIDTTTYTGFPPRYQWYNYTVDTRCTAEKYACNGQVISIAAGDTTTKSMCYGYEYKSITWFQPAKCTPRGETSWGGIVTPYENKCTLTATNYDTKTYDSLGYTDGGQGHRHTLSGVGIPEVSGTPQPSNYQQQTNPQLTSYDVAIPPAIGVQFCVKSN